MDGEELAADAVVIAMGPWSGQAAKWLPVPDITGQKYASIVLRPQEEISNHMLFLSYKTSSGKDCLLACLTACLPVGWLACLLACIKQPWSAWRFKAMQLSPCHVLHAKRRGHEGDITLPSIAATTSRRVPHDYASFP